MFHRMRRYSVPVAIAAAAVATVVGAGLVSADGSPDLPERTAAELLAELQDSDVPGLSGTVVAHTDLGIPAIATADDLLAPGSRTVRMWYAAPDRVRLALLDQLGETDVIRNGADVWQWDSRQNHATHFTMSGEIADLPLWPPSRFTATSPMEAAEQALARIEPGTDVSTDGTAEVAGRSAYELVLEPKEETSLVSQVRLAVDAETGVPLRTRVLAVGVAEPAFEVAFSRVEFDVPDQENFTFNPPAGVDIVEGTDEADRLFDSGRGERDTDPMLVGEGWTTVAVTDFDIDRLTAELTAQSGEQIDPVTILDGFDPVEGAWGAGHLMTGALVSLLVTDDGRLLIGAVTDQRLFDVAADV